jgi:hypothetical protein
MLSASARLFLISGRLVALAGAALTVFAVVSWVVEWASASYGDGDVGLLPLILPLQALLALWVARSAITGEGPVLFRHAMLAFVVSFVLFYGWYFLLLWDLGPGWMVVGNFAYLASGLIVGLGLLLSAVGAGRDHDSTENL